MNTLPASPPSRAARWTGRMLTVLVVLFLLMDAGIKLVPLPQVIDSMRELGFSDSPILARGLGVLLLTLTALHLWPRTAVVGAVLLTGYLGGAVASQLRIGAPWWTHLFFGVYVGAMMWGGLLLRRVELRRSLFPTASGHADAVRSASRRAASAMPR